MRQRAAAPPEPGVLTRTVLCRAAAKGRIGDASAFPWPPPSLREALGPSFLNEHGDRVSLSNLTSGVGRYVGLFFGAASGGAGRSFARRLAASYAAVLREGGGLEVVYVPGDGSEAEADAARREAPWLSLPYAERWRKEALM